MPKSQGLAFTTNHIGVASRQALMLALILKRAVLHISHSCLAFFMPKSQGLGFTTNHIGVASRQALMLALFLNEWFHIILILFAC